MSSIFNYGILQDSAERVRAAESTYEKAWRSVTFGELLPADRFWQIHRVLVDELIQAWREYGRHRHIVRDVVDEMFRKVFVDELEVRSSTAVDKVVTVNKVTFDDLMKFANNWTAIGDKLYHTLFEVVTAPSDDAYGDFLDNLPLAGRRVIATLLEPEKNKITDNELVRRTIANKGEDGLLGFIWSGEHYFRQTFDDAAKKWFLHFSETEKARKDEPQLV